MPNYLEIYKKFKETKEIKDYIDDVILLQNYYTTQQFLKMQEHIQNLKSKYVIETIVWNSTHHYQPLTIEQAYINAENFLCKQGAIMIAKNVKNYAQQLSQEEFEFIESLIKSME